MGRNNHKYDGIDLTGARHGRLTAIRKADKGRSWWVCACDCGKEVTLLAYKFFTYKSCGCLEKENKMKLPSLSLKHGMANTKLYHVYCGMKDRCYNVNGKHYDRYGARGIKMCDEWKNSFERFAEWAKENGYDETLGQKEQSIDRIDVNGDYCPENCRFSNQLTQTRNQEKSIWFNCYGERLHLEEFSKKYGIPNYYARRHIRKGYSPEEIITIWELHNNGIDGYYSTEEASKVYGVTKESIYQFVYKRKIDYVKKYGKLYIKKDQNISA